MSVFEQSETIKSWDDDYYHPIAERFYDRAILDVLSALDAPKGATVLDAGCGPGVHSIRAARAGHKVTAIDISSAMLREARRRVEAAGVADRVSFHREDLTKLSLASASITHAFSWGVIIHIPDVEKALDELARVIAPRGRLALYLSNESALDAKIETIARIVLRKPAERQHLKLGTGTWYDMHGERLWVWQFNVPELCRQMSSRGFNLVMRRAGEFSELQRRVPAPIRAPLLHLNNIAYAANFPAAIASANLLVFEKGHQVDGSAYGK